jgi:hypothetical protein
MENDILNVVFSSMFFEETFSGAQVMISIGSFRENGSNL